MSEIPKFEFWFTLRNRETGYRINLMVKKTHWDEALDWWYSQYTLSEFNVYELIQVTKDYHK